MADIKYVKEYLSTGTATEGSLLIVKKIYDTLIEEVGKSLIPRTEAAIYMGPAKIPGSSVDIDLETPDSMSIRLVGEGAAIPQDNMAYSSFNMKPDKYGVGIRITKEFMEDGKWNLLQRNIAMTGKRFAENENSLVITQLDSASNTVSGGAAANVANMTRAIQYLEDKDYDGTTMLIGMEFLHDLRNIDTFLEYNKSGDQEVIKTGFRGVFLGAKLYKISTNAGMTTTSAYVYDNSQAYVIAEKRPITIENFDLPVYDLKAANVTQRIKVRYLRADAICKITTT